MNGPCLCGDPSCGSCFPGGQTPVSCIDCGWEGRAYELGFLSDESSELDVEDACPECGSERLHNEEPQFNEDV